jgi:hypothetical protein
MTKLNAQLFLNISASYISGGQVNYYDKNQIADWDIELNPSVATSEVGENSLNGNDVNINALPKRSKTDMLMIQMGISLPLNLTSSASKAEPRAKY